MPEKKGFSHLDGESDVPYALCGSGFWSMAHPDCIAGVGAEKKGRASPGSDPPHT